MDAADWLVVPSLSVSRSGVLQGYAKIALCVGSVVDREELRGADGPLLAFRSAACEVLAIPSPAAIAITTRSLEVLRSHALGGQNRMKT
jgi:hypothetical protein